MIASFPRPGYLMAVRLNLTAFNESLIICCLILLLRLGQRARINTQTELITSLCHPPTVIVLWPEARFILTFILNFIGGDVVDRRDKLPIKTPRTWFLSVDSVELSLNFVFFAFFPFLF